MNKALFEDTKRRAERRMERVRDALIERTDPDEILDDFFVLWRAYETTFETADGRTLLNRAQKATATALAEHRIQELRAIFRFTQRFYEQFGDSRDQYLAQWFPKYAEDKAVPAKMIAGSLKGLKRALDRPASWRETHSNDLATILYYLRSAIFHGSLATTRLVREPEAFAGIREAMIELIRQRLSYLARSLS
jgi:hypothetical protein